MIWKDSYDGYQVNEFGDVFNMKRKRLLIQFVNKNGYKIVNLRVNKKPKTCTVHRLVAQAFIPNPDNLPCVNHKDEDKTNNHVENLEWCTYKYNSNYGTAKDNYSKKVGQFTEDGELVKVWRSTRELERETNIPHNTISTAISRGTKISRGYIWKFI